MALLMHGAGGATLPALKVRHYLPLSISIPSQHHPRSFAAVFMQNPPLCCFLGSQNVNWAVICFCGFWKNAYSFFAVEAEKYALVTRNQYRSTA